MRHGLSCGADDYLTQPFTQQELREAVDAQLNKLVRDVACSMALNAAVTDALSEQQLRIKRLYEGRLASSQYRQWPDGGLVRDNPKFASATVLESSHWSHELCYYFNSL